MTQDERIGRNNARFREANESIREVADKEQPPMRAIPFLCECPREDCRELVPMSLEEYANVRAHPARFVNAPGHDAAEGPHVVVERADGYVIIDKTGPSRDIVVEDSAGSERR